MYNHLCKVQQVAQGEGKIVFSVDIHCIGTSGKTACSMRHVVDLLLHTNALHAYFCSNEKDCHPSILRYSIMFLTNKKFAFVLLS